MHVAFRSPDRKTVDEFFAAAIAAGGKDNGPPGIRRVYHEYYYGAYVTRHRRQQHRGSHARAGMIDHVTLRVSDFQASKAFYMTVLAPLGYEPLGGRRDSAAPSGATSRSRRTASL